MPREKSDVLYGTLALMVLKTLDTLGPLHGYGLARRIEQVSGEQLALNQGTLYPALLRLEQEQWVVPTWGTSDTGRRVKLYAITKAGRKRLHAEQTEWKRAAGIVGRFLALSEDKT